MVGLIAFMHIQTLDATPIIGYLIVDASQAALEADFVKTHTGEFVRIGQSERQVSVPYRITYDIEDDAIAALRMYRWDRSLTSSARGRLPIDG